MRGGRALSDRIDPTIRSRFRDARSFDTGFAFQMSHGELQSVEARVAAQMARFREVGEQERQAVPLTIERWRCERCGYRMLCHGSLKKPHAMLSTLESPPLQRK